MSDPLSLDIVISVIFFSEAVVKSTKYQARIAIAIGVFHCTFRPKALKTPTFVARVCSLRRSQVQIRGLLRGRSPPLSVSRCIDAFVLLFDFRVQIRELFAHYVKLRFRLRRARGGCFLWRCTYFAVAVAVAVAVAIDAGLTPFVAFFTVPLLLLLATRK